MKDIKFRAWDKLQRKMVGVDRINFDVKEIDVVVKKTKAIEDYYSCSFYEIELMQCTGLKDKNDKEIYEGDIVRIKDGYTGSEFTGVVAFENGSFIISDGSRVGYRWLDYDREILGNKFDNKGLLDELLKEAVTSE